MTVEELIEVLEGFDANAEVKIATQPGQPFMFAYDIEDLVVAKDIPGEDEHYLKEIEAEPPGVVYVVEGSQLGLAPEEIRDLV